MEITSIAPERNDEGNCRLDSCAGHVELFFLDRWRRGAVDSTLRGKELHRLLGSLCFHKQSSKGRKKIFLNSLRQVCCVRKQHCVITFIQFCESPVVCIFAFLCMRVVVEDTVYFYAFLRALAVWPFWVSRGMRANRGPEAPTFHVLLIYSPPFTPTSSLSEILLTTLSYTTCNSLYKPFCQINCPLATPSLLYFNGNRNHYHWHQKGYGFGRSSILNRVMCQSR